MKRIGIQAFLDMLADFGVKFVFGNPGTTELPLNDALANHDRLEYVLGLQEVAVMAMADGYAMASGSIGVVNLHICCGLGNAMGMLYNAFREGTPLIVTAGQQDRRLAFEEPILGGDMVGVTRPWTKWSAEIQRVEDLPVALRRAVQTALTPPTGPVFLSIPVDIQMEASERLDVTPIRLPDARVRPPVDAVRAAARVLASAKNPGILAGSRITERDAMDELVRVAEMLGAPVMTESGASHGRLAFPSDHPLNGQGLPLWSPDVRERLDEFDVILVAGMDLLRQYVFHEPSRAIPEHARIVHLDEDPWQLGKNYPVEVGVIGHSQVSLHELAEALVGEMTLDQTAAARQRGDDRAHLHRSAQAELLAKIDRQLEIRPLTPLAFMGTLAKTLPPDVAVVEEAVTTTNTTFERLGALRNTTGYFAHRGWALGWGVGVSIGVQLAWPDRPVLALLGEGATMYGAAGLWTAARHNVPVTFVVCNNAQYQILKIGARGMQLPEALAGRYSGFDITGPEIDFVGLAQSLGVPSYRVEKPDELADVVSRSMAGDRPVLIDVPIARETPGRLNYG